MRLQKFMKHVHEVCGIMRTTVWLQIVTIVCVTAHNSLNRQKHTGNQETRITFLQ